MGYTVHDLLTSMDSRELSEWIAFSSLEPIGDERADYRAARVEHAVRLLGGDNQKIAKLMPFSDHYEEERPLEGKLGGQIAKQILGGKR